jgi:hypothetical protein
MCTCVVSVGPSVGCVVLIRLDSLRVTLFAADFQLPAPSFSVSHFKNQHYSLSLVGLHMSDTPKDDRYEDATSRGL